jgi:hypothetical protein
MLTDLVAAAGARKPVTVPVFWTQRPVTPPGLDACFRVSVSLAQVPDAGWRYITAGAGMPSGGLQCARRAFRWNAFSSTQMA